ncbi:MAG: MEDS domain-containing protein [Paludibaculum sp.]
MRPISLAGSELTDIPHVCALFNDDEEEYRVLLPFIRDGFECGDKAVHIVNPEQQADHFHRLSSVGIDTNAVMQSGQLDVRNNTDTYLLDGHFDQDRMLGLFTQMVSAHDDAGFPASRLLCRMDWAAEGRTHVDNLIEFESRANDLWRTRHDVVVCTYHLNQFSGDAVVDIVRTHPYVIIGGILRQNPFFEPPEQFLPKLRARRKTELKRRMGA